MNRIVSFIRRKILRIPADRWDYQYDRGVWDGLEQEYARFDAVVALTREYHQAPDILEIGCGKGQMLQRMNAEDFSGYTGVDLSEVAVAHARQFETERVRFVCADMQRFEPDRKYDVIAFNESLYYAKDPAEVFARYCSSLKPGGSMIITAFENKYTAALWPALDKRWTPLRKLKVQVENLVWNVQLYRADS
jgi:2-polyprenyl-6-hydroxyphenyl methylase/3-demethylubiquinone-9 3-methyltransferase